MAHKTREEYKKNCKFYVLGWCCENQPIKKKVCKSDCDRMKKYKTKISWKKDLIMEKYFF